MKHRWVGLLDCNNFFVSCERLFRPDLIGKPVVVLSSNDGCVVARSQEVKDTGVPMGVPYFKIKDTLKKYHVTTFSSHFALYRDISRRVMAVMCAELERIEQYSVDEAFFSVEETPEEVAWQVKQAVEKQVGIPVSVGLAATRTQAKYANSLAKKGGGVKVLAGDEWEALAAEIPLSEIWGVGGKMELKFKRQGLLTVASLLAADPASVSAVFGVAGVRLQQELAGNSVLKKASKAEVQQSITHSRSFHKTITKQSVLADAVAYHVRQGAADLRQQGQLASVLKVFIRPSRHGDFVLRGGSKEAALSVPTSDTLALLQVAESLLTELYEPGVPYKKAGVVLSGFSPADQRQDTLFPSCSTVSDASLMQVIDQLNQAKGKEVVLIGSHLARRDWQPQCQTQSPAYTTRWSDLAQVKA